jgi:hypothetical protein
MEVSRHDAERVHLQLSGMGRPSEAGEEVADVVPALEKGSPRNASVHHVVPGTGFVESRIPRHRVASGPKTGAKGEGCDFVPFSACALQSARPLAE